MSTEDRAEATEKMLLEALDRLEKMSFEGSSNLRFVEATRKILEDRRARDLSSYRADRPNKDWNACPYRDHVDDCDCGGMGGNR